MVRAVRCKTSASSPFLPTSPSLSALLRPRLGGLTSSWRSRSAEGSGGPRAASPASAVAQGRIRVTNGFPRAGAGPRGQRAVGQTRLPAASGVLRFRTVPLPRRPTQAADHHVGPQSGCQSVVRLRSAMDADLAQKHKAALLPVVVPRWDVGARPPSVYRVRLARQPLHSRARTISRLCSRFIGAGVLV